MTGGVRFELCTRGLAPTPRDVLAGYQRAFASRGVTIEAASDESTGPLLFTNGADLEDAERHCFWSWHDEDRIDPAGRTCSWIWHHGPARDLFAGSHPRVVLLPRNDLFEIRGLDNTADGWADYRARITSGWSDKRDEIYFRGHFTGRQTADNHRVLACRLVAGTGRPANVGLLAESTPPALVPHVPIAGWEPLDAMGQYRYVLSLWGNHPFNARLYRGLEAGSLVFHQATPTVRLLDDGVLVAGRHYVEIAPDLSDLVAKVEHFVSHPSEARAIAEEGHRVWMETLFVPEPYTLSDLVWERLTSQPSWEPFCRRFAVH